jgi:hypothetical protein
VLVIMTRGIPVMTDAAQLIADLSRLTWQALVTSPAAPAPSPP